MSKVTKEMALDKAFVEKLADFMAYEQLYNSCQDIETMFRKSQEGEQPRITGAAQKGRKYCGWHNEGA